MTSLPVINSVAGKKVALPPCIDRRTFLAHGSLAGVMALLATACGDGVFGGGSTSPGSVNTIVTVSDYPALANVGGIAKLNGTSTPVAVVRSGASTFRAFSMVCTHEGTTIGIQGSGFLCPNHEARFNAAGQNIGGQVTSSLHEFTVTTNATATTLTIAG